MVSQIMDFLARKRVPFPIVQAWVYRFELLTHQLVSWLMQVNHPNDPKADLPDEFWHWLLIGSDPADDNT